MFFTKTIHLSKENSKKNKIALLFDEATSSPLPLRIPAIFTTLKIIMEILLLVLIKEIQDSIKKN